MQNLRYVTQPHWRVRAVHYVAKLFGVLAHVEGMPIGSNRIYPGKIILSAEQRSADVQQGAVRFGGNVKAGAII